MKKEIDTSVPPYFRPRPAHWPEDYECNDYYSSIIPKLYIDMSGDMETRLSSWSKCWVIENHKLLEAQREEVSPVFTESRLGAAIDARAGIRDFNKQGKLDRRDAAIEAGDCSAGYSGQYKDGCRGCGTGGECFRCPGQIVKLKNVDMLIVRHTSSGGARQPRQRGDNRND